MSSSNIGTTSGEGVDSGIADGDGEDASHVLPTAAARAAAGSDAAAATATTLPITINDDGKTSASPSESSNRPSAPPPTVEKEERVLDDGRREITTTTTVVHPGNRRDVTVQNDDEDATLSSSTAVNSTQASIQYHGEDDAGPPNPPSFLGGSTDESKHKTISTADAHQRGLELGTTGEDSLPCDNSILAAMEDDQQKSKSTTSSTDAQRRSGIELGFAGDDTSPSNDSNFIASRKVDPVLAKLQAQSTDANNVVARSEEVSLASPSGGDVENSDQVMQQQNSADKFPGASAPDRSTNEDEETPTVTSSVRAVWREPSLPVLEATLVDEGLVTPAEIQQPVYDAVPVNESRSCMRKYQMYIIASLILVIGILVGVVVVSLSTSPASSNSPPELEIEMEPVLSNITTTSPSTSSTSAPTEGAGLKQTSSPSSAGSTLGSGSTPSDEEDFSPTIPANFIAATTASPREEEELVGFIATTTALPSGKDVEYCFPNGAELKAAVDDYIAQDCTNNSGCSTGPTFGWPMNSWCVKDVTDMSYLFQDKTEFNEDLSQWDMAKVTNMRGLFQPCSSFNGDISSWNVSSVRNTGNLFDQAKAFNGNISEWDVSSVTYMRSMFFNTDSFSGDISSWDVSSVTNMQWMFIRADSFNSDISSWDISSVTDMSYMFQGAIAFNQNLCSWGDIFPCDGFYTSIFGLRVHLSRISTGVRKKDPFVHRDVSPN